MMYVCECLLRAVFDVSIVTTRVKVITMRKATYTRKRNLVLKGDNFVTKSKAKLSGEVIDFVCASIGAYSVDPNVDHIKAGACILERFEPKWKRAYFKAAKDIIGKHHDFAIVMGDSDLPKDTKFSYDKIKKSMQPDARSLPALGRTIRIMKDSFLKTGSKKTERTPDQIHEALVKRTLGAVTDYEVVAEAVKTAGVEERREIYNKWKPIMMGLEKEFKVIRVMKKRVVKAKAKPATKAQLEKLVKKAA